MGQANVLSGRAVERLPPMPTQMYPDPEEAAARINAAAAYANLDRAKMAQALGMSPATYDRMTGKRSGKRGATWTECARVAEITGLPYAFFSVEFERLPEIAPQDVPLPQDDPRQLAIRLTRGALDRAARRRASRQKRAQRTPPAADASDASA